MQSSDVIHVVTNIVAEADVLKRSFVHEDAPVNYVCIFCQNDDEYTSFLTATQELGKIIQETPTGPVFHIKSLKTVSGILQLLKIRKPDSTRTERGDADFTLSNYEEFKKQHIGQKGFSHISRKHSEMIELMDPSFNVRVYFSHPPLDKELGII